MRGRRWRRLIVGGVTIGVLAVLLTQLALAIAAGTAPARKRMHARIALKADQGPQGSVWTGDFSGTGKRSRDLWRQKDR